VEIKDYLQALGKRAWVVILVPLLAGALALGYQLGQPPSYSSTVTVVSHPASAAAGSVIQYITSFQAAMSSDTIINQVGQQAGLSSGAVRSGLSSQPSGVNSVILKVSFTTTNRSKVAKVPDLAARDTLDLLARPSVTSAQATLDADRAEYDRAKAAVDQFTAQTNLHIPLETYRQELAYISNLQVAYEQAFLTGQASAKGLQDLITTEQARVDTLGVRVAQWSRLDDIEVRDATAVANAQTRLSEAQAELVVVQDPSSVAAGDTTKLSPLPTIIKLVGPVVVVALVLAIGVIILLETMRARRRRTVAETELHNMQGAVPPPPPGTRRGYAAPSGSPGA
jgi:capsular polysaccharide biosynthesis protein